MPSRLPGLFAQSPGKFAACCVRDAVEKIASRVLAQGNGESRGREGVDETRRESELMAALGFFFFFCDGSDFFRDSSDFFPLEILHTLPPLFRPPIPFVTPSFALAKPSGVSRSSREVRLRLVCVLHRPISPEAAVQWRRARKQIGKRRERERGTKML
jgi:hypothetical protein